MLWSDTGRQASYDKLRVLLLSGKLATAVALARTNSNPPSKRRHEDMPISATQGPKQWQRPSAAGPLKSARSGDGTYTRRRADSYTATETTRNQNARAQVARRNTHQTTAMTRSTSVDESTADMFTAKSRYTHTSRGVQAQIRESRENTRDPLSPPLTRSNSRTQTSDDMPTRPHSRVRANLTSRTILNSKARANPSQKSKALLPLENFV